MEETGKDNSQLREELASLQKENDHLKELSGSGNGGDKDGSPSLPRDKNVAKLKSTLSVMKEEVRNLGGGRGGRGSSLDN